MPDSTVDDVIVEHLIVDYGKVRAVDGVSFTVKAGELVTLLGQSGCGKTSTLRAIAGLEHNSGGTITIGGAVVSNAAQKTFVAPERRNIGMVFQSYALWPHMTVAEAVAYPLRRRKVPKSERLDRVMAILATVGMAEFAGRRVPELSGGQQQRVALARALVYEPRLLLLDEPLSNLDARLRERMRLEIKELQSRVGITTICVTHDQAEALTMSHRVIVMQGGRIEQIGTPQELYDRPLTRFAGESVGKVNVLACRIVDRDGNSLRVEVDGTAGTFTSAGGHASLNPGDRALLIVRPEKVSYHTAPGDNVLEGIVVSGTFAGDHREYHVDAGGQRVTIKTDSLLDLETGAHVFLHLPHEHLTAVTDSAPH